MISMTEYAHRRQVLMQQIGPRSLLILPAANEILRNGDVTYPFRQHSDFYYLSGLDEPEAVLVLAPGRAEGEYILFNRPRDSENELWEGPRVGQDGATAFFLADQAFPISEFPAKIVDLLTGRESIHYPLGIYPEYDKTLLQAIKKIRYKIKGGSQPALSIMDISASLHEMRVFKSEAELATLQEAVNITATAHMRAMSICQPGLYEYQLEAEIMFHFLRQGARGAAYPSIVGSGERTCILHYTKNDQRIQDGDLVLIDAGAEYQHYAADVTRTFPANGRFSAEQREIYELVLASQLAAIDCLHPGTNFDHPQHTIIRILTQGLIDLGIIQGSLDGLIEQKAYLPFYMHRSGHWLGLDVHDVGTYQTGKNVRVLQPGMTLTIEPGLYLSAAIPGLHPRWHHIGVRIEDDVLISPQGAQVLSQHIPKTVADIEALMASS